MTLSLVSFPPFSRSLARDITSGRWSLPLPGDRELYLIPVVILAKFRPRPVPPRPQRRTSIARWGELEVSMPVNLICPRSPLKCGFWASKNGASAGLARTLLALWADIKVRAKIHPENVNGVQRRGLLQSPRAPQGCSSTRSPPAPLCCSRWPPLS